MFHQPGEQEEQLVSVVNLKIQVMKLLILTGFSGRGLA